MTTLHPGDTGAAVAQVQQALLEAGESIDAVECAASTYGPSTQAAVATYQAAHGLVADGLAGPRTMDALRGEGDSRYTAVGWRCDTSLARPDLVEVLRYAIGAIGTVEDPPGSNRGKKIDAWNTAAGVDLGSSWCAAFATSAYAWCPSLPIRTLGSAFKVKTWGVEHGCIVAASAPLLAGDLAVRMRNEFHGHVWIVGQPLDGDAHATVEGNCGGAVRGMVRQKLQATCYVRPLPV